MSLQTSTFKSSRVLDNEIIKASDFEFAFEQVVENVAKATQMFLESEQDFVINGKVIPNSGMNLKVSPIYGVCKSTGIPFGRTETTDETIAFEGSQYGRIDIIEVKGEWETYDEQQRAFNDPDTDTQTYQYVDTKKRMLPVYRVIQGIEGAGVAPEKEAGWVKLAEVSIRPGASSILASDIHNITADVAGTDNESWTNEEDATYNIGYISDVNKRFRVQHNEDGTHADDCINANSLDIGIGTDQINGNILPVGGSVSIPTQTVATTDSILSVFTKIALMITGFYNSYVKFGAYGFNGSLSVSAIADENNVLTKPITISAAGDGTATVAIDGNTVLSIDGSGKLSTNGYTPTSPNHIVTKAVTDSIITAINNLTTRVENIESTGDQTVYSNGSISMGTNGRYNIESLSILVASTSNVTLLGIQTVDGVTPNQGDIVLVKDQTDQKENGIYTVSYDSVWQRTTDYDTPEQIKNKIFVISSGSTNAGKMFYTPKVNFTDEDFGTDEIPILEYMATSKALANRLIIRDENGRAQVAAPSAENDIARKAEITSLYGNVVGTDLGTAAVGTATTFARSDHVHPMPACVCYACYALCLRDATNSSCYTKVNYGASGITNPTWLAGWNGYELRAVQRDALTVCCAAFATQACAVYYSSTTFCMWRQCNNSCCCCSCAWYLKNLCSWPAIFSPMHANLHAIWCSSFYERYMGLLVPAGCQITVGYGCITSGSSQYQAKAAGTRVY